MTQRLNGIPVSEIVLKGKCWSAKKQKSTLPSKRRVLIEIAKRDGMHCCYCERHLKFGWMEGDYSIDELVTFEHTKLKKDGGCITAKNGKIACRPCNENRADQDLDVFLEKMAVGYYVTDEVEFRRAANKARKAAIRRKSYSVRCKRRQRKEKLAYILKAAYTVLNPAIITAALR